MALAALVAESGALDDGDVPGLPPLPGGVASVDALGAFLVILHGFASSLGLIEYLRPACKRRGNRLGTKYYTAFPGLWSIPRRKVRESFPAWMLRIGYHGHPWESMGFGEGFSALPALRGTGFYLPWVGSGTKCEGNTRRKRANALAILPLSIMIRTHAAPAVPGIGKP